MMEERINKILNSLHEYATSKGDYSFEEFIDFCVYPDMIKQWLVTGTGCREIKRKVFDLFLRYEEQRKLLSA